MSGPSTAPWSYHDRALLRSGELGRTPSATIETPFTFGQSHQHNWLQDLVAPPNDLGSRVGPSFLMISSFGLEYRLDLCSHANTFPYSSTPPSLPTSSTPNQETSHCTDWHAAPTNPQSQDMSLLPPTHLVSCWTNLAQWVLGEISWILTICGLFTFKNTILIQW